jgi:hypothetical protein
MLFYITLIILTYTLNYYNLFQAIIIFYTIFYTQNYYRLLYLKVY